MQYSSKPACCTRRPTHRMLGLSPTATPSLSSSCPSSSALRPVAFHRWSASAASSNWIRSLSRKACGWVGGRCSVCAGRQPSGQSVGKQAQLVQAGGSAACTPSKPRAARAAARYNNPARSGACTHLSKGRPSAGLVGEPCCLGCRDKLVSLHSSEAAGDLDPSAASAGWVAAWGGVPPLPTCLTAAGRQAGRGAGARRRPAAGGCRAHA